jgi:hypothetical protein
MKNMRRNWNRETWKGREDMANTLSYAELTPPKAKTPPVSKL